MRDLAPSLYQSISTHCVLHISRAIGWTDTGDSRSTMIQTLHGSRGRRMEQAWSMSQTDERNLKGGGGGAD